MPSVSKSQQRLFGMAYAYKKGELKSSDIDSSYRDKVISLAGSMSIKKLKDFAKTSHEGLPNQVEEGITPGAINGMGPVVFSENPGGLTGFSKQTPGSGDHPHIIKKKKKNKKRVYIKEFNEWLNSKYNNI